LQFVDEQAGMRGLALEFPQELGSKSCAMLPLASSSSHPGEPSEQEQQTQSKSEKW
jgi:hypothetical protein